MTVQWIKSVNAVHPKVELSLSTLSLSANDSVHNLPVQGTS